MFCAIWYHLYNLKNVKNTHGAVLLLVKLRHTRKVEVRPWGGTQDPGPWGGTLSWDPRVRQPHLFL